MPFDSNGTFNRVIPGGWKADALAGIKIRADRHDDEDDGFATGLSTCITKDGRTQPTANIPMNQKKLINLGEPTNPADGATKNYVDNFKTFSTGANIDGAGPINGFINFTAPTGINGIGWTTADMSWVGKLEEALKYSKRLAINNAKDGTGTDVLFIDETGRLTNNGVVAHNLSYDGSAYRTIALGRGTRVGYTGGTFSVATNDVATTVDFQVATLRNFFSVSHNTGSPHLNLDKEKSGAGSYIQGSMAGKARWRFDMGNATAETATDRVGSDFYLYSWNNAGTTARVDMSISRQTQNTTIYGPLTSNGGVVASNTGTMYFRPNGYSSAAGQWYVDTSGNTITSGSTYGGTGYQCRQGTAGGYTGNQFDIYWGSPYVHVYIDATYMGAIMWQSDYRFKKGVKALGGMWEKVKSLRPISYSIKKWGLFEKDDTERWGFVAHEMQDKLYPAAATGSKDADNVVQQIDPLSVVAALTKALQEAMARIEALEAKA